MWGAPPSAQHAHVALPCQLFYCCYVYFERQHLQHIYVLIIRILIIKQPKASTSGTVLGMNFQMQIGRDVPRWSAHTGTRAHAPTPDTCVAGPLNARPAPTLGERPQRGSAEPRWRLATSRLHRSTATLLAGRREVRRGNQRRRKRRDPKRSKPLAARRRRPVCRRGGEVTARVFLLGWNCFNGLRATKNRGGFRTEAEGGSRHTHTHARARAHTRLRRAGRDPEEGRGVVTPATAGARPSAPAISAGRSAGTRTPPPAAPSAAKATPFPPPPPVSDAWARAGLEPAFPRGGGRRARAGTRICHLQSTNHQVARPAGGSP